jgi:hypothetical protein
MILFKVEFLIINKDIIKFKQYAMNKKNKLKSSVSFWVEWNNLFLNQKIILPIYH